MRSYAFYWLGQFFNKNRNEIKFINAEYTDDGMKGEFIDLNDNIEFEIQIKPKIKEEQKYE